MRPAPRPTLRCLVVDGDEPAALALVRALGLRGATVHVATLHPSALALHSRYAQRRLTQPRAPREAAPWLAALQDQARYDLIVPAGEAGVMALHLAGEGSAVQRAAVLPPPRALETVLHQEALWERAQEIGVALPPGRLLVAGAPAPELPIPFPVALQPARRFGAFGEAPRAFHTLLIRDAFEREAALRALLPQGPVWERAWVVGRATDLTVLYRDGRFLDAFAAERLHEYPRTGGRGTYQRSLRLTPALLDPVRALLDPLGWHGLGRVTQRASDAGDLLVTGVSAAPNTSVALALDAGANFPGALVDLSLGRSPEPFPPARIRYRREIVGDVAWWDASARALPEHALPSAHAPLRSVASWGRLLLGRERWAEFSWRDRAPGRRHLCRALGRGLRTWWARLEHLLWRLGAKQIQEGRWKKTPLLTGRILILSQGNVCRSPLAAALLSRLLPDREVESAGLFEIPHRRVPPRLVALAHEIGVDLSNHRSRMVTAKDIEDAELILVMDRASVKRLKDKFPGANRRSALLGLFGPTPRAEIDDPLGKDEPAQRRILHVLMEAVQGFVLCLKPPTPPPAGEGADAPDLTVAVVVSDPGASG